LPTSEPAWKQTSKRKTYAAGEEVAFKRKPMNDLDWVHGKVARIVGEGESRRYEVRIPENGYGGNIYKVGATRMTPIPPEGSLLQDYMIGKEVLALYPGLFTFNQARVTANVVGSSRVEIDFDIWGIDAVIVERRMVLDPEILGMKLI
jgi:SAGA-associated factor 29